MNNDRMGNMRIYAAICLLILLICHPFFGMAQLEIGPNDTINPGVPVTLTARYGEVGLPVILLDDEVRGPFPIGFSFHFFGNSYNQFYIGANGWISFSPNPNSSGIRRAFAVPNSDPNNPKNCILGPFQDFKPDLGDSSYVFYLTTGPDTARRLVVMWCQVPMFSTPNSCNDSLATFQIILHEGTNTVESQIFHKPTCSIWLGNGATLGLQNNTGFIGYAVPGRNGTSWTATREGWLFTPATIDTFTIAPVAYHLQPLVPGNKIMYSWYQGSDLISNSQTITVIPNETTTYRARVNLCDGEEFTDTITIVVMPSIPNAFTPNGDGVNDIFRIVGIPPESITRFNFRIYNRWGQQVFSTNSILEGWDGTFNGESCPVGVYPWVIYYEDNKKTKVTNRGVVTIVREQ
jgi:gliding motility-associated-like protein